MIGESKVQYCREKQLIPVRHIYGLQFFNNCFAVFTIFHQLFQSAEETFFTIIYPDRTLVLVSINEFKNLILIET